MDRQKLGIRIIIGSLVFLLLYFVWLKWPRTLESHFDRVEETVSITGYWHLEAGQSRQFTLETEDPSFSLALKTIAQTNVQHAGLTGKFIDIKNPPLYRIYLTAIEGHQWREVGDFSCDMDGNLYMGSFRYTITQDAGLLAWLQSLEGELVPSGNAS